MVALIEENRTLSSEGLILVDRPQPCGSACTGKSLRVLCNDTSVDFQITPERRGSIADLSHVIYRHQVRTDAIATRPTNVLNLALRVFEDGDDVSEDARNEKITELTNVNQEALEKCGVRR